MLSHAHAYLLWATLSAVAVAASTTMSADKEKPKPPKLGVVQAKGAADSLEGYWEVTGKEHGDKDYDGMARIVKKGRVYFVIWMIGGGSYSGVGLKMGDTFSVSWAMTKGETIIRGINVYKIGHDKLAGEWSTLPGDGTKSTETMEFIAPLKPGPKTE